MVKRQYPDKDGNKKWFYTCGAYSRSGTEVCTNHYIRHKILERIVLDDLNTVIGNVKDIKSLVDSQWTDNSHHEKQREQEIESIRERLKKIERLKKESYLDYKEELLSKNEYLELRKDYLKQEQLLKTKLEKLTNTDIESAEQIFESAWFQNLVEIQQVNSLDRETVVEFVEKIEIGEKDEKNQQKITIHYRFSDELKDLFQIVYRDIQ